MSAVYGVRGGGAELPESREGFQRFLKHSMGNSPFREIFKRRKFGHNYRNKSKIVIFLEVRGGALAVDKLAFLRISSCPPLRISLICVGPISFPFGKSPVSSGFPSKQLNHLSCTGGLKKPLIFKFLQPHQQQNNCRCGIISCE